MSALAALFNRLPDIAAPHWQRLWGLIGLHRIPFIIAIAALFAIAAGILVFTRPGIEQGIRAEVNKRLHAAGYKRVTVQVAGRDVLVQGKVSSRFAGKDVARISEAVARVRVVRSQLHIEPVRLAHFILRRTGGELALLGEVPAQHDADVLVAHSRSLIDHQWLENDIRIDPEVARPDWLDAIPAVLSEANRIYDMELEIGAGRIALGGIIKRRENYSVLSVRMRQFADARGSTYVNRVGIAPEDSATRETQGINTRVSEQATAPDAGTIAVLEDANTVPQATAPDTKTDPQPEAQLANRKDSPPPDGSVQFTRRRQDTAQDESAARLEQNLLDHCQSQINLLLAEEPINFPPNMTELSVNYSTLITNIAKISDVCPTSILIVVAHTDSTGRASLNQALSEQRAKSVMLALMAAGIPPDRLKSKGLGDRFPIDSNATREGQERNRRIEIALQLHEP